MLQRLPVFVREKGEDMKEEFIGERGRHVEVEEEDGGREGDGLMFLALRIYSTEFITLIIASLYGP